VKTCTKCGKRKKEDKFFNDSSKKDGKCPQCKDCKLATVRDRRNNTDREKVLEGYPDYYKKNKERKKRRQREYRKVNRLQDTAHKLVEQALKSGKLKKKTCEHKGCSIKKTEAHHEDYSKPLEVTWLCKKHHGSVHRTFHSGG
jgi:hypothetical protein